METPNALQRNIEAEALPNTLMPSDIRSVFPAGQFILMLLAACYFAGEIILPIVLAFVLSLVLHPLMRLLEKLHLPRSLAALAIIMVLGGSIIGLGAALSGPAVSWAQKLPEGLPRLQERLSFLNKPIHTLQKFLHQAEGLTQETGPAVSTVVVQGSGWSDKLLSGTRTIAGGLFTTVLVLFFLLIAGDIFLPGPSVNQHPTVVKVSNGGATVNNTWLTLSAVMGQTGAVYLDRTGVFDNNLLVLTSPMMGGYSGDLWEFDSAGNQVRHIGPISSQYFLPFPGECGMLTIPSNDALYGATQLSGAGVRRAGWFAPSA